MANNLNSENKAIGKIMGALRSDIVAIITNLWEFYILISIIGVTIGLNITSLFKEASYCLFFMNDKM